MRFEAAAGEQAARYDWSVVTDRFEDALAQAVGDGRAARRDVMRAVPAHP